MRIEDLDTPFLMVDLDALEENLDRYQAYFDTHGIGFRPHIKTHKMAQVAKMESASRPNSVAASASEGSIMHPPRIPATP